MRKPRVIIYDDDATILHMLEMFLSMRGYDVRLFSSPVVCPYESESLSDRCKKLGLCADIIISDFIMPNMTGIELLRRQANRGCRLDIKMKAIMSGCSDDKLATQCKDLGCRFFRKPFNFAELSAWLTKCEKRFDLSQPLNDRRVNRRHDFRQDIEYRLNSAVPQEIFLGKTFDINNEGLGLHLFNPLKAGDKITIVKGLEKTHRKGVVTWCSKEGDRTFKAGLHLLNS